MRKKERARERLGMIYLAPRVVKLTNNTKKIIEKNCSNKKKKGIGLNTSITLFQILTQISNNLRNAFNFFCSM